MFKDRVDAGQQLALRLKAYAHEKNGVILGLARGGVVVASTVANVLQVPFDIIVPRKIGAPQNRELALGAIAEGAVYLDEEIIRSLHVMETYIRDQIEIEKKIADERTKKYRSQREKLSLKDKIVILIDDGIATGSTMKASILAVKKQNPQKIVVAVPVGPKETISQLEVDECICLFTPDNFMAVGQFYRSFPQVEDQDVMSLCRR